MEWRPWLQNTTTLISMQTVFREFHTIKLEENEQQTSRKLLVGISKKKANENSLIYFVNAADILAHCPNYKQHKIIFPRSTTIDNIFNTAYDLTSKKLNNFTQALANQFCEAGKYWEKIYEKKKNWGLPLHYIEFDNVEDLQKAQDTLIQSYLIALPIKVKSLSIKKKKKKKTCKHTIDLKKMKHTEIREKNFEYEKEIYLKYTDNEEKKQQRLNQYDGSSFEKELHRCIQTLLYSTESNWKDNVRNFIELVNTADPLWIQQQLAMITNNENNHQIDANIPQIIDYGKVYRMVQKFNKSESKQAEKEKVFFQIMDELIPPHGTKKDTIVLQSLCTAIMKSKCTWIMKHFVVMTLIFNFID